jgi:hypothetical protein
VEVYEFVVRAAVEEAVVPDGKHVVAKGEHVDRRESGAEMMGRG